MPRTLRWWNWSTFSRATSVVAYTRTTHPTEIASELRIYWIMHAPVCSLYSAVRDAEIARPNITRPGNAAPDQTEVLEHGWREQRCHSVKYSTTCDALRPPQDHFSFADLEVAMYERRRRARLPPKPTLQ